MNSIKWKDDQYDNAGTGFEYYGYPVELPCIHTHNYPDFESNHPFLWYGAAMRRIEKKKKKPSSVGGETLFRIPYST